MPDAGGEFQECGGCTACCTVNGIVELDKPDRTPCEHECAIGCAIYQSRPQSCKNFMCVWVRGFGGPEDRPDRLGIFIEERPGCVGDNPDPRQFFVKEVRKGAVSNTRVKAYLTHLAQASGQRVFILDENYSVSEFVVLSKREQRHRRAKRRK